VEVHEELHARISGIPGTQYEEKCGTLPIFLSDVKARRVSSIVDSYIVTSADSYIVESLK
jgi:hypothetical protein